MKNSVIYIVGATVLVGGVAYLFLKNKKAKDKLKLAELQTDEKPKVDTTVDAEALALKISDAKELANMICELKKNYNLTEKELELDKNFVGFSLRLKDISINNAVGVGGKLLTTTIGMPFRVVTGVIGGVGGIPISIFNDLIGASKDKGKAKMKRPLAIKTTIDAIKKLKELGYTEKDCKIVKSEPEKTTTK